MFLAPEILQLVWKIGARNRRHGTHGIAQRPQTQCILQSSLGLTEVVNESLRLCPASATCSLQPAAGVRTDEYDGW